MSTYTTNYNLEKPDSTDDFKDFRSNYNSNMDIIDANLGGGGGGNVDDVLVNGVSVVDGNHDAQITSYKEVTQAEYDALPSSKLTDGIAYFIKDAGGGGGGSSSHNYSTTEQVIGTWIDGKPLYEITLNITPTSSSNLLSYDVSALSIDTCINIQGYSIRNASGNKIVYYSPTIESNNYMFWARFDAYTNSLRYKSYYSDSTCDAIVITLQYTKTTD